MKSFYLLIVLFSFSIFSLSVSALHKLSKNVKTNTKLSMEESLAAQAQALIERRENPHKEKENKPENKDDLVVSTSKTLKVDSTTFIDVEGEKVSLSDMVHQYLEAKSYCGKNWENCKPNPTSDKIDYDNENNDNNNEEDKNSNDENQNENDYSLVSQNYNEEEKPLIGKVDPVRNEIIIS